MSSFPALSPAVSDVSDGHRKRVCVVDENQQLVDVAWVMSLVDSTAIQIRQGGAVSSVEVSTSGAVQTPVKK